MEQLLYFSCDRKPIKFEEDTGIVSWGDEEMSASYAHPVGRHVLPRLNPGFQKIPPKSPVGVIGTTKHVVYDGLGYLVLATKA
jgi:hypothetical protein